MNSLTSIMTSKLYNELETNLYSDLFWNTEIDAHSVIQTKLDSSLFIGLNRRLNETVDDNLFDELDKIANI